MIELFLFLIGLSVLMLPFYIISKKLTTRKKPARIIYIVYSGGRVNAGIVPESVPKNVIPLDPNRRKK